MSGHEKRYRSEEIAPALIALECCTNYLDLEVMFFSVDCIALMFKIFHQKVSTLGVLYQFSGSGGDVMQVRSPPINLARGIHTRGYKDNDGW